jgi:uncharacterized protein (UPF0332 family)
MRERRLKKHKEVRSMLHRHFIQAKKIDRSWGKHYDWLFDNRHKADYRPLIQFDADQVKEIVEESERSIYERDDRPAKYARVNDKQNCFLVKD